MADTLSMEDYVNIGKIKTMVIRNELDDIKTIMNAYTPVMQVALLNNNGRRGRTSLFNYTVRSGNIPIIQYFIEKGANINIIDIDPYDDETTPLVDAIRDKNIDVVRLLVENGATLTVPDNLHTSILHMANDVTILKFLIERGAPVDELDYDNDTPLNFHIGIDERSLEFLEELLKAGANANTINIYNKTPLEKVLDKHIVNIKKIEILISHGATLTDTIQNQIKDNKFTREILDALYAKKPIPWRNWTKSDAIALDEVFNNPSNFSVCPICLKHTNRQDGCMYMHHTCPNLDGLYNKELYEMYKNPDGSIYWCTLCNRICHLHRHYQLSIAGKSASLGTGGNSGGTDCRPHGGGYPEKVQRFRRLREYALELSGREKSIEAFNELTEEFWNAPLRREEPLIKNLIEKGKWQNTNKFPNNVAPKENEETSLNIKVPETLVMPTLLESGSNSISLNDNVRVLQFHHETTGGIDHKNSLIGVSSLKDALIGNVKNFFNEEFGFCIQYPECKAKLYPAEIKNYVSDDLYNEYKEKFNRKFKNMSGGANVNFFGEATDAKCSVKGGKRKTRRKISKKKKTRRRR